MEETLGTQILPISKAILFIVFSYLIGSIPFGLIVARISGGIDIREHGSGNIGLTNVIRTLGWGPGLVTGFLDFLKGYLPVFLALKTFSPDDFAGVSAIYEVIVILVALLLLIGNLYPVYILFKGGKGVATGLGVMSALIGVFIFIPLAVFGVLLFIFRYVSIGSIGAALSVPITIFLLKSHIPLASESPSGTILLMVFSCAAAILIVWKHRRNIARILNGTEPRVGSARTQSKSAHLFSEPQKPLENRQENHSTSSPDVDSHNMQ